MSTGKILGGVLIGVGAIAAAPFTGGGSLFAAGVSLSAALGGTAAAAAVGAGVVGGVAGAAMSEKEKKEREKEQKNQFKEGVKTGSNKTKQKFNSILKTQKRRDELMLTSIKVGVYVAKVDGVIDEKEIKDLEKLSQFIHENPTTPPVIKDEINKILKSEISFNEIKSDVSSLLKGKSNNEKQQLEKYFLKLIQTIINSDGRVDPKEEVFLTKWKNIKF